MPTPCSIRYVNAKPSARTCSRCANSLLTPGARRTLDEALLEGHAEHRRGGDVSRAAPNRWRYAFDASASIETGISLGFHGCAMTVGSGSLSGTEIGRRARSASRACVVTKPPAPIRHPSHREEFFRIEAI